MDAEVGSLAQGQTQAAWLGKGLYSRHAAVLGLVGVGEGVSIVLGSPRPHFFAHGGSGRMCRRWNGTHHGNPSLSRQVLLRAWGSV